MNPNSGASVDLINNIIRKWNSNLRHSPDSDRELYKTKRRSFKNLVWRLSCDSTPRTRDAMTAKKIEWKVFILLGFAIDVWWYFPMVYCGGLYFDVFEIWATSNL